MRTGIILVAFILMAASTEAGTPYRNYLISKMQSQLYLSKASKVSSMEQPASKYQSIPHYQIPTGAVFCRLEDRLTRATKVWIKIGVK